MIWDGDKFGKNGNFWFYRANQMEHFIKMNGMKIQMEILIIMGRNVLPMKEFNRFWENSIILVREEFQKRICCLVLILIRIVLSQMEAFA